MKHRTKALRSVAGLCVFTAGMMIVSEPALAKPDKPINAATPLKGTGCLVRDADGNYHLDTECEWHIVQKLDKDGNPKSFIYQDKGKLPEGAPHPSSASKNSGALSDCDYTEVTTPSGQYSSKCMGKY